MTSPVERAAAISAVLDRVDAAMRFGDLPREEGLALYALASRVMRLNGLTPAFLAIASTTLDRSRVGV